MEALHFHEGNMQNKKTNSL